MTPDPSIQARRRLAAVRLAVCAAALAASAPALAYVPPASAILKRVAQHRDEFRLTSLEVRGAITFFGPAADRARSAGLPAGGPVAATFLMKVPGRCRLEVAADGGPAAQRPAITMRSGRVSGTRSLPEVGAARALVEAACTVLAEHGPTAEPERGIAQRLAERGVDLRDVAFGRYQGRVAWVLGGKPQDGRPQAWIDKTSFDPVRLIAASGGALRDVRFIPAGAASERFPRTIEIWSGGQLEARFSADSVTPNPRLPDSAFP